MVVKEKLHLGQVVLVGEDRKRAVIDGLTQTCAGVVVNGKGMELVRYENMWEAE